MQTSGACSNNYVNSTNGVRPALHLNLSSAALGAAGATLKNPENVTTTYNGDVQTLKSAYDANPKGVSWYNKKWYEHVENYVTVTPQGEMKNAGEYWVKVELQQKWFDDMDAQVEAEGAEKGWTAEEIAAAKLRKKPKFKGEPDTSDGAHTETDRIRWFKFTIAPKEITVTKPTYDPSTGVFVAPKFANEGELYADKPVLATRFTGTADADGSKVDQIDRVPNKRGTYTAQAIFVNSETDKTEYKGNYVIKNASEMTCTVKINRSRLAIPAASDAGKPYTGGSIAFALSGYSTEWTQIATLKLPDGLSLEGSDSAGWRLSATDAGVYTVTASILPAQTGEWCWNTSNFSEEVITDRTFTVTITRKTLTVDFTSTTNGFLLQAGESVTFGAEPANALDRDDVVLTLEYINAEKPNARFSVAGGKLDASTLNPGTYYLVASLDDDVATGNKNYQIDGGEARREFTVSAKNIVINSVNWQYSQNNGVPAGVAGGAGGSASSPFAVTYNGSAYVFSLNTNGLESAGVKVDPSFGTSGYKNGSQTNATDGAVAVTVRLIPFDASYAFNDENGKPLADQFKEFTLYVKVNKADVDFSNVKWSADALEFNAVNQSVSISSGFPAFLKPNYSSGATGRTIGTYTAAVTGVTVSDATVAANYNIPTSTQIAQTPTLTHRWEIVKKRITVTWVTGEETGDDGTVIFVPSVSDNSVGAIEYTYYNADRTKEMTLDEIFADYDATTLKDYYVCARLKSTGTYNSSNCVLIEGGQEVTESYQGFQAGGAKTPVRVGLETDKAVYNGSNQPAQISFEGGNLTINDFTITYTKDGAPCSVPRNAGKYRVHVALSNGQEGEYAITGVCDFDYEIEKAEYDVSAMKWVDTENGNAEYEGPYVYTHGVTHNMLFTGDNIDGLTVNYTADTEENRQGGNAKQYKVVVTFSVRDPENYKVPDDVEFIWEILPFTPDLSEVTWNYHTESPFVFTIENGVPVKYSVFLCGIPEGLEELIKYGGDTAEYSDAGSHVTTFEIDENNPLRSNYGELVFGGGLDPRLVWEIQTRLVDKAAQRQTQTFRAEGYTFEEITNLPEDFAQYFDVKVLDDNDEEIPQVDGTWIFYNVDRYRIQILFKQGMNQNNGGTADNVKWSDNGRGSYMVTLMIEKLVFEVKGWIDGTENGRATLDADDVPEIEKYFDYIIVNPATGDTLPVNAILEYETVYTIALKLKEEYAGNVAVRYLGHEVEETAPYGFQTGVDPLADDPEHFYRKPTGKELTVVYRYKGEPILFTLGSWFVEEKMQILSGVMQATEEGTYPVRVGFKKGALSAWESDGDSFDRAPVTITFIISTEASGDRFILTSSASASHPYKFQYGDFTEETLLEEYVYSADKPLYITRLAVGDTLADLLAQFENGADITVFDANGSAITDLTTALATGMTLRLMDGSTVLNQLTLSVLGDINGDGRANVTDKTQLNAHLKGSSQFEGARLLACDITGDGKINVTDKSQLNAQLKGERDIYGSLTLKTRTASVLRTVSVHSAENETEAVEEIEEEGVCEASETAFGELLKIGNAVQEEEERESEIRSCEGATDILIDEKHYAICNRRKMSL